ncbi:dUTP diphosphatase [Calidifontibacter indicus]|uniref:Deoxyuridine 5'-triphosphate nucleotidohydrolase n=1 Tax=Calidifontibacter indicus TaxID=419650 RepID=A0A3D9UPL3_9MICO|nr:dUTP diphosphatase [Calidifontibacter indicus]REF31382.1 dUTP pyrophosphatase [Calidifontibacter indicus]
MTDRLTIRIKQLDPQLPVPAYARPGDAGMDLFAAEPVRLEPGERALVATGIAIAVPDGWVGLVHPRSGLAHRHGISMVNAPGTIDAGYRGEIKVNLINLDRDEAFDIARGDRIAQLVVQQCAHVVWEPVDELPASVRGETGHGASGGFGSGTCDHSRADAPASPSTTSMNEDR